VTDLNPLSQLEVEREIMRLSKTLTEITADVAHAATEQARTEVDYKLTHTKAWLMQRNEGGTVPEKEARALHQAAKQFEDMMMAQAVYRACQESGRNVRAQLDALRSVNANVRDAVYHSTGRGA
jgi:hypothetical protein